MNNYAMNRSFRGRESLMPSIRQSVPQLKSLHSTTTNNKNANNKEDDLALFLEMRKRDKEKSDLMLLNNSDDLNHSLVSQPGSSPLFEIPMAKPARKTGPDEFLNSDGEKNDYDWLLTPPGTPLFPSLEMESRRTYMDEVEAPKAQPTALRSRLANSPLETGRSNMLSRQPTGSTGLTSSVSGMRRPSSSSGPGSRPPSSGGLVSRPPSSGGPGARPASSGGPGSRPLTPGGSRPATPTGRPTLISSKSSRPATPTSRTTLPSAKSAGHSSSPKPTGSLSTRSTSSIASTRSAGPSRSATPTRSAARPAAPSAGPSRSSTPTRSTARSSTPTRSTARSSTPTARPTVPTTRPTSRTSTPTRRPSTASSLPSAMSSASLNKSSSSLSSKSGSVPSRNPAPSRGASPTVRSRPWNPSEMPGFSLDAPPNLRTTLPDRPLSATRGRPAAPSPRSSSVEPAINGRQRRQSRSPSRGRAPNGYASGSSVPAMSRAHSKVHDDVSPVVIGTKMVERVVHMRKLAPPRQDDKNSPGLSGKSASSPDSSGFGRTLSKKSLDMAIRHMDIRRSIPGNLRPLMTKIPASSMYSVRSGPTGSRTASVSDSPIATSSNASSDHSVNNHLIALDGLDDDFCSERNGHSSPISVHGR
ncbi:hypothetical protein KSS87_016660 [Heliosperma pusillum]|nr:hypothetical protein KSS87_016660 [Heliosperma pusillum]